LRLSATDPEELLIQAHGLEDRLKTADLGGIKELKRTSPQDEEMEQEVAAQMLMMEANDPEAPKRGEPMFLYVSKISEPERAKILSQAFKRAKEEAGQLAKAAGVELGALHHLEDSVVPAPGLDEAVYVNVPEFYRFPFQERARTGNSSDDKQTREAVGSQPGKVTYRVVLSAAFELRRPDGK
jgi:hypothetical protein